MKLSPSLISLLLTFSVPGFSYDLKPTRVWKPQLDVDVQALNVKKKSEPDELPRDPALSPSVKSGEGTFSESFANPRGKKIDIPFDPREHRGKSITATPADQINQ